MTSSAARGETDDRQIQAAFARYLRDPDRAPLPEGIDPDRLAVYRDAVFLAQRGLVSDNFPSIRKLYDDAAWDALVRAYLVEHRCQSPNFIDVPGEFLAYLERRANDGRGDPPFLVEMAEFELLETEIGADLRRHDLSGIEPEGDLLAGAPAVNPILRLVVYSYPVHAITPDYQPTEPPAEQTFIAAFRTTANRYRYLDLNPLTAALLQMLVEDAARRSGRDVLEALAAAHGLDRRNTVTHGGQMLERMREAGAILGSR